MEESGIVSIWLGSFESREALAAYAENRSEEHTSELQSR